MLNEVNPNIFLTKYYLLGILRGVFFMGSFLLILPTESGINPKQMAIIIAVYSLVKVIFEIPSGAFADRFGNKRTLVLATIICMIGFYFLLIRRGFWDFMIFFILLGLRNTLNSGALEALIYDNMKNLGIEKNYAKYEIRKSALMTLSFGLSVISASYLITFGYNFVINCTLISMFCSLIVLLTIKDISMNDTKLRNLTKDYWKILINGCRYSIRHSLVFKIILFVSILGPIIELIFDSYYEIFLFEITNKNKQLVPILLGTSWLIASFVELLAASYMQKQKLVFVLKLLNISMLFAILAYYIYAFPLAYILLLFFWVLLDITLIIFNSKSQAIIPSKIRATVNSFIGFVSGIVGIPYLILFGFIANNYDYRIGFLFFAIYQLIIGLIFLFIFASDKHLQKKEALGKF